jgi:arginine exporter protein ArgO
VSGSPADGEVSGSPAPGPRTYPWPVIAWTPFAAGLGAGLGIALPLGAIGVLIVREGVERGIRAAVVAAVAVATVDFGYALLAVVVGQRIADALAGVERAVQLVGAAALTAVVVVGVRDLLRSVRPAQVGQPATLTELPVGYGRTFLRFVGLTAINPMTAVYFVALTAGLSQRLAGPGAGAAFAVGVLLGSLSWQLVLAIGGGTAGSRMSERVRIGVSLAGYAIVAGYALKLALGS